MTLRKKVMFFLPLLFIIIFFLALQHERIEELVPMSPAVAPKIPPLLPAPTTPDEHATCTEDLGWLDAYNFSSPFLYASRRITPNYVSHLDNKPFTLLETPLFSSALQQINLTQHQARQFSKCESPIVLNVQPPPKPAVVNASHMIFGIQTTIERLSNTTIHLASWLPNTGAQLYVVVIESEGVPASDARMKVVEQELREKGVLATVLHPEDPDDSFPERYFSLVNIMYGYRRPETEWVVLLDDDTFIPSIPALVQTLRKFDSSVPHYVGSLSEKWEAVSHDGLMGYGGAGIFLSIPLASILTEKETYHSCKNDRSPFGDFATMDCIYSHTPYKLNHIPGLHQVDIAGDISGLLESGRQLLSLHHWKNTDHLRWKNTDHPLPIEKMNLISEICDAASCFLRRWQFQDKFVLTNGWSINQYPEGQTVHVGKGKSWSWGNKEKEGGNGRDEKSVKSYIGPLNLEEMERTWDNAETMFTGYSLEPTRPRLELGKEKLAHRLVDAVRIGDEIRQVYVSDRDKSDGLDTVLILYWSPGLALEKMLE